MHKMRKKDRMLTESEARQILEKGEYGILSTYGEGYSYGVPVSYAVGDNCIYIHGTPEESHKRKNIEENPNVCFTVVGETKVIPKNFTTKYESAIIFGKVIMAEMSEKKVALEKIIEKYSGDYMEKGMKYIENSVHETEIYKIIIERISGKGSK